MSDLPKDNAQPVKKKKKRINVRKPDIMAKVEAEVEVHYKSSIVEKIKANGGEITIEKTTIKLAQQFGFCYGVERAIDLAYASRKVFEDKNIYLIYDELTDNDVVIVPAFGAPTHFIDKIEERGAGIVDTTCGDVMKVWRRVRTYAKEGYTSIIHGKAGHEETLATASHR